ncbi:MAG TPA: DNA alkylation repair protein [Pyrinomonadaceae bacterium]|jgi:3-methyladenine DNA glycosylase AlkD|nr:DNA alkylation repair protein [Pyrinomonadaceae bacterium]
MNIDEILKKLESLGSVDNVAGMERFGIVSKKAFGISAPVLKQLARQIKKQATDRHALAQELWKTGIYDARAVAFLIDDPKQVTRKQMDEWAKDFDNWATVDGTCSYLFCRTPFAYEKAVEWSDKKPEFIKRAGFSLMAYLAVHDKKAEDEKLAAFLPLIEKHSDDDRNFVKKAVNWALRQIGKRNLNLNKLAIETAERIRLQDTKPARWISADALRELMREKILERLKNKAIKRSSAIRRQ